MKKKTHKKTHTITKDTKPPNTKKTKKNKLPTKAKGSIDKRPITKTEKIDSSPIFKDEKDIEACNERNVLKDEMNMKRRELNNKIKECDEELYKYITKYFDFTETKSSINNLLKALYKLYKHKKSNNADFVLTMEQFINMFPRDTSLKNDNFRRQHVFEAICLFLLYKNYDNNKWGEGKIFYNSMEKYISGEKKEMKLVNILSKKINDGSAAQSVDIFFKIPNKEIKKKEMNDNKNKPTCLKKYSSKDSDKDSKKYKDLFVLIQNKYYDNEKSSADKYDVLKIHERSQQLRNEDFKEVDKKIVLMVNNKSALDKKISNNHNKDFGLVDEILGVKEMNGLNDWFQKMLYDMLNKEKFEDFIGIVSKTDKPKLKLRFHQDYFIDITDEYLNNEDEKLKHKKFIWGAVPRSGKSYMIGGMIDKRNEQNIHNDVVVILGAKTETETQFKNMFQEYENFSDYKIITVSENSNKKTKTDEGDKAIYISSQEKFKVSKNVYSKNYPKLFERKHIDIYFDEIHKGGTSSKAQQIIQFFINEGFEIDLFVMVTATYAKPILSYKSIIEDKPSVLLTWNYEDQQYMKQISNSSKYNQFIMSKNDTEKKILESLFKKYNLRYGKEYLKYLENEYKVFPELVIIQPFIDNKKDITDFASGDDKLKYESYSIHGNLFKLKCDAVGKTLKDLKEPTNIFYDNQAVVNLINFIGKEDVSKCLCKDSIYGKLTSKLDYNITSKRHTQLWFLPDKNLYNNHSECKDTLKETGFKTKTDDDIGDYDEIEKEKGLPNIEPLSRGLVLNLLNNSFFKQHFCFLIVNNQKVNYFGTDFSKDIFKESCVEHYANHRIELKKLIHSFEEKTYAQDKSLIILTGSILRLGVSLPCVDIALNFDGVKSVDLNMQTMFRVLTEREDKKYGYYIDLYPDRAIQFLYDYTNYYTNTNVVTETKIEDIQNLIYLFNYNGIGLIKQNTEETSSLYTKLIDKLKLNEDNFSKYYISNIYEKTKKIIQMVGDEPFLDNLSKIKFVYSNDKNHNKKGNLTIKPGKEKETAKIVKKIVDEEDDKEDDKTKETTRKEKITNIFNTYIPIISLFSIENDCYKEDNSFNDCLENLIKKYNGMEEKTFEEYCIKKCNEIEEPLGCYLHFIKNIKKEELIQHLELINELYDTKSKYNQDTKLKELRNHIHNIYKSINKQMGKKQKLIYDMTSEEIQKLIEEYLPIRKTEKNNYGEVFTPQSLINEMLDKLPTSVWKNPEFKWLDPANGIGNFPMIAFQKLDEGLKDVSGYKDDKKRREHIVKNMLYMVELNPKNVAISRKIFGKYANIFCGSFLEDGWKTAFRVDKFDVIMGNPPFNDKKEGIQSGSRAKNSIWDKFVLKSLNVLNKNQYLTLLHPAQWRGLGPEYHKIWDILSKKQLLYLHIFSKKDGNRLFNIGSRFDVYVLQNKENTKETEVIDELGVKHCLELNKMAFLPNYAYKEIDKILTTEDKGINVIMSYSAYFAYEKNDKMNKTKTSEYKYPVIHSITQEGITYWYSNDNTKGHFGVPKVILNFNEHQYSHLEQNDYEGKYGMSQISFGIPIKSKREGDLILKAIETPEFKTIIAATKWGAFQTDYRMFKYFKPEWYKILLDEDKKKSKTKTRKARHKNFITKNTRHKKSKTRKLTKK